jgi:hypothetical protein
MSSLNGFSVVPGEYPPWNEDPCLIGDYETRLVGFKFHYAQYQHSPLKARCALIIWGSIDLINHLLVTPVHLIYNVASAVFGLFAIPFGASRLEDVLKNTEYAIKCAATIPCKLVRLPVTIANQLFVIIVFPEKAKPIAEIAFADAREAFLEIQYNSVQNFGNGSKRVSKKDQDITKKLQTNIYKALNDFSRQHSIAGRFFSVPVSLIDITLEVLKSPISVIDNIALGIFLLFTDFRTGLARIEVSLKEVLGVPITVLMAPVKFAFQTCAILYDPAKVSSISEVSDEKDLRWRVQYLTYEHRYDLERD